MAIFSGAITEIEESHSDLPFEEVSEPESLDEELESLLEVLEILHPFTLETETEITALHGAKMCRFKNMTVG